MIRKCIFISLLFCSALLAETPQYKVVIPEFTSEGTAADAFKNLEKLSKQNDPKKLGIRILFKPKKAKKVNLNFSNMPVDQILRYICISAGYKYKITNRTVNITVP